MASITRCGTCVPPGPSRYAAGWPLTTRFKEGNCARTHSKSRAGAFAFETFSNVEETISPPSTQSLECLSSHLLALDFYVAPLSHGARPFRTNLEHYANLPGLAIRIL